MKNSNKFILCICGFCAGILNGLLGSGGGMLIVPMLEKSELEKREAHATSIFVILPITLISAFLYIKNGHVTVGDAIPFIPLGIVGAVIGSRLIKKIKITYLRFVFAGILIYSSIRMFFK